MFQYVATNSDSTRFIEFQYRIHRGLLGGQCVQHLNRETFGPFFHKQCIAMHLLGGGRKTMEHVDQDASPWSKVCGLASMDPEEFLPSWLSWSEVFLDATVRVS